MKITIIHKPHLTSSRILNTAAVFHVAAVFFEVTHSVPYIGAVLFGVGGCLAIYERPLLEKFQAFASHADEENDNDHAE